MSASFFAASQGSNGPLEQLIYVSVGAIRVNSALQMADILAAARPNNARDGISGALTGVDGRFIQIVEGSPGALDHLMRRLAGDERHRDVTVVERRSVRARAFPGWDMVSPRLIPAEADALAALLDDDQAGLDDYIPVLSRAIGRQAALIEAAGMPASGSPPGVRPGAASLRADRPED